MKCTVCGTTNRKGQWWHVSNYFGLSGNFCPSCYDKVSHDSHGNPNNLKSYERILQQQEQLKKKISF